MTNNDVQGESLQDTDINSLVKLITERGSKYGTDLLRRYTMSGEKEVAKNIYLAILLEKLKNVSFFKKKVIEGTYESYLDSLTDEEINHLINDFIHVITKLDESETYDCYFALLMNYRRKNARLSLQTKKEG